MPARQANAPSQLPDQRAQDIVNERARLLSERDPFKWIAQQIHDILGPANSWLGANQPLLNYNETRDTTARRAAMFYGNGMSALSFPKHDEWFAADPPMRDPDDAAKSYYHAIAEELRLMLEDSNFYDVIPGVVYEGGAFGTGLFKMGQDSRTFEPYFVNQPFGTFYITEDMRGRLVGVYRDLQWTAKQILNFLGPDTDITQLPPRIQSGLKDPNKIADRYHLIHCVKELDVPFPNGHKFGDFLVWEEGKTLLKVDSHAFMPFFVRRHARFANWTYGYGPGWMAIEDGHQASEASRLFEAFAARTTFPSIKATGDWEGQIRLGAGQVNWGDPTAAGSTLEGFAMPGDYKAVMDLMQFKHANIEQAFYADLFSQFAAIDKTMTAMEASLREGEKNVQLYPSALRLESETGRPMLLALYEVAMQQQRLPEPPDSVRDFETANPLAPRFRLRSRVTVSVRQQRVLKLAQFLEMFAAVFEADPSQALRFDWDQVMPDIIRDSGLPEDWIASEEDYAAAKQEQDAAAQAMQQAEVARQAAGAIKDASAAGPDVIQQMVG